MNWGYQCNQVLCCLSRKIIKQRYVLAQCDTWKKVAGKDVSVYFKKERKGNTCGVGLADAWWGPVCGGKTCCCPGSRLASTIKMRGLSGVARASKVVLTPSQYKSMTVLASSSDMPKVWGAWATKM